MCQKKNQPSISDSIQKLSSLCRQRPLLGGQQLAKWFVKYCLSMLKNKERLRMKTRFETFLDKASIAHGAKYVYLGLLKIKGKAAKIQYLCNSHGVVSQTETNHVLGAGCAKCAKERPSPRRLSESEWLDRAKIRHGDTYSYGELYYRDGAAYFKVVCNRHGPFEVTAKSHTIAGTGCIKCFREIGSREINRKSDKFFLEGMSEHRPDLSILGVSGLGNTRKISVLCDIHGPYTARYQDLKDKKTNCPKCANGSYGSKLTYIVTAMLDDLGINYETEVRFAGINRRWDIVVESKKLAVELDGVFWHSSAIIGRDLLNIDNKAKLAEGLGYRQINFFEDEIVEKPEIVKRMLASALGVREKGIGARKCTIKGVAKADADAFLESNHIQGAASGSRYLGLYRETELVAIMAYARRFPGRSGVADDSQLVITRFATSMPVQGAFSKLLKACITPVTRRVITYSDPRLFTGDLYRQSGFVNTQTYAPDYCYVKNSKRIPKRNLQKSWFFDNAERLNLKVSSEMTEQQLAEANNFFRLYDRGRLRWELTL